VTLQLMQLVGISANVIWVTWPGPHNEYVHQLWDVCNTKIRGPRILGPVTRQPALPWQAVCILKLLVVGSACYQPHMKWIRSPS